MPNLLKLPTWAGDGAIHIVVETPRGARAKLTYDPVLKTFVLSKSLMLGLSYPYDWGFIPSTRADDGDPLDALVNHDAANLPRSCDALQAARRPANASGDEAASDPQRADHRGSRRFPSRARTVGRAGAPAEVKQELEKFFAATDELEAKTLKFWAWRAPKEAKKLVRHCEKVFKEN
jgi:inorganic pyrophosphatase